MIENLVTDGAARWQTLLGHVHTQTKNALLRHKNGGAIIAQLVGDSVRVELANDF